MTGQPLSDRAELAQAIARELAEQCEVGGGVLTGDLQVVSLVAARVALDWQAANMGEHEAAFDETVQAYVKAELRPARALVVAGRGLAREIDAIYAEGTVEQRLRAGRLVPLLTGVLREMRAGSDVVGGDHGAGAPPAPKDPEPEPSQPAGGQVVAPSRLAQLRADAAARGRPA